MVLGMNNQYISCMGPSDTTRMFDVEDRVGGGEKEE